MQSIFTNRLSTETSPYLLQHAHNPVDWYPWGEEALNKAKAENKVILVSIGYSACHWCHVMEKESFENEAVAALMNEHFVNVKIDREERPDLDHIYMDALQIMTGSGGWPMNMFLTPDAKPFYGGTYFPPERAFNRSSWTEVLQGVTGLWKDKRNEVEAQADNLTAHLEKSDTFINKNVFGEFAEAKKIITEEDADTICENLLRNADKEWGGFGNAPKFPQTFSISYLLQYSYFTGNKEALQQALLSIDKMLDGGIFDHVGGGLARYSTDRQWLAPHFEKMLYDNALLIWILCDAYQLTKKDKYKKAIGRIIAFAIAEMQSPEGGFYAALDADSEGEEGRFYVWSKAEVVAILGETSDMFCTYFDVSEKGNWEGKNILRVLNDAKSVAASFNIELDAFNKTIENDLIKLYQVRSKRIRPGLDDKIILSWNALWIKALAKAAIVLGNNEYKEIAKKTFSFIIDKFSIGNSSSEMYHTYKNGVARYPAFLDDYAYFVAAALELYKLDFEESYLHFANKSTEYTIDNFSDDEDILFFYTGLQQKDVIVRKKDVYDGAIPSANGIMANNILQLSIIFNNLGWANRANNMLASVSKATIKYPGSFAVWGATLLQQLKGMNEVVVIGELFKELAAKIQLHFIPNVLISAASIGNDDFPMLAKKGTNNQDLIYLCHNYACKSPLKEVDLLLDEINRHNKIMK